MGFSFIPLGGNYDGDAVAMAIQVSASMTAVRDATAPEGKEWVGESEMERENGGGGEGNVIRRAPLDHETSRPRPASHFHAPARLYGRLFHSTPRRKDERRRLSLVDRCSCRRCLVDSYTKFDPDRPLHKLLCCRTTTVRQATFEKKSSLHNGPRLDGIWRVIKRNQRERDEREKNKLIHQGPWQGALANAK